MPLLDVYKDMRDDLLIDTAGQTSNPVQAAKASTELRKRGYEYKPYTVPGTLWDSHKTGWVKTKKGSEPPSKMAADPRVQRLIERAQGGDKDAAAWLKANGY